jgi:hypothetical protein
MKGKGWAGYTECVREMRSEYNISVREFKGRSPFGDPDEDVKIIFIYILKKYGTY